MKSIRDDTDSKENPDPGKDGACRREHLHDNVRMYFEFALKVFQGRTMPATPPRVLENV